MHIVFERSREMKKKLIVMTTACLAAVSLFAETETVNGIEWTYQVSDGKASISTGNCSDNSCSWSDAAIPTSTTGSIEIPSSLGGYPVTSIGVAAFRYCSKLTCVTIPNSVTSIVR